MGDVPTPGTEGGSDRFGKLLADAADEIVGPARLANPRVAADADSHDVPSGADSGRRRRHLFAIAAALALLAVAAFGAWVASDGQPTQVPAGPGVTSVPGVDDEPGPTSTTTTSIVADPAAVEELTAAIEATMSVSWVAEVESESREPEGTWEVTYQPASPSEGRPYATARVAGTNDSDDSEYELFLDERGSLVPCHPAPSIREEVLRRNEVPQSVASHYDIPCEPPAWARLYQDSYVGFSGVYPQFSPEQVREMFFAQHIPLLKVDPSVANLDEGTGVLIAAHDPVHAFFGDVGAMGNQCFADGCGQFSLRVEDGLVTSLALRWRDPDGIQGSLDGEDLIATMELRDFGTAPAIDVPPEQDIVDVPAG